MKHTTIALVMMILCITGVSAATDLWISPASQTSTYNQTVTAHVMINTTDSVAGAQLKVVYDPTVVQGVSVSNGGFLTSQGDATFDAGSGINSNGTATFNMIITTPNKGINGSASLATITFTTIKKNGESSLRVTQPIIANNNGLAVPLSSIKNASISVFTQEKMVINEVMPHPASGQEFVELYNNGTGSINVLNWKLNNSNGQIFTISSNLTIPSHGFLTVFLTNQLNDAADTIKVISADGIIVDTYSYSSDPGVGASYGRSSDGTGSFVTYSVPTPDSSNNNVPTGSVPAQNILEDTVQSFNASTYISDPEGDSITYSITQENSSRVDCSVSGSSISMAPALNWNGMASCTIRANDGKGTSDHAFNITVVPVNDPLSIAAIPAQTLFEGSSSILALNGFVSDIDTASADINWSAIPSAHVAAVIDNSGKTLNLTSADGFAGSENITIFATDGQYTANRTFPVTVNGVLSLSNVMVTIDGIAYPVSNGAIIGPASPGSHVSASAKVNNNYSTSAQWVQGIVLKGHIDSFIDDTQMTSPPFTLNGKQSTTKSLAFNDIPVPIPEGLYEIMFVVNGTDYTGMYRQYTVNSFINITTAATEVRILNQAFSQANLSCYRESTLDFDLVNTGETVQYVNVTVANSALGVYESAEISINPLQTLSFSEPVSLPTASAGSYPFTITAKYDDGAGGYVTVQKTATLYLNSCFNIPNQDIAANSSGISIDVASYVNDPLFGDSAFSYTLLNQSNAALVGCSISTSTITCALPATNETGISTVWVEVSKDTYSNTDSFTISVGGASIPNDDGGDSGDTSSNGGLEITDVDATPSKAKPDEKFTVDIEVENNGELDIEDIDLDVKILDDNGNVVDNDGDDLEEEEELDLDEGDDDEFTFTFTVPADANDNDDYTIFVSMCGRDENHTKVCVNDTSESISIEREKHEVLIYNTFLSPDTLDCFDTTDLTFGIKNIGREDEDVVVSVSNDALGISETDTIELDAEDEDDYKQSFSYALALPTDLKPGAYPLKISALYDDGEAEAAETVTLTKKSCPTPVVEEKPAAKPAAKPASKPATVAPATQPAQQTQPAAQPQTSVVQKDSGFVFEKNHWYVLLIVIATILALGTIIFIILALFSR